MLYDKKWESKVIVDPFSMESFVTWLERQKPREKYCYLSNGECLLAKYFTAMGFRDVHMFTDCFVYGRPVPPSWGMDSCIERGIATFFPRDFNYIAMGEPETFGGALKRARSYLNANKGQ